MPKYVIERDVPGAGDLNGDQLRDISQTSCRVLSKLGYKIQSIESYVTADKIYCIYRGQSPSMLEDPMEKEGVEFNALDIPQPTSLITLGGGGSA